MLSIDQLFYGMMLPSGNDAAYTLAEFFGRILKDRKYLEATEDDPRAAGPSPFSQATSAHSPYIKCFLLEMNFYAYKLGLSNTFYDSPHGLMNKHNTSCAADVAKLIRECMIGGTPTRRRRLEELGSYLGSSELRSTTELKETRTQTSGWLQQTYRRVVGTKRHDTTAVVPTEVITAAGKKQAKNKKKAANVESGADESKPESQEPIRKIKLKTRKYRWENTNKLLNVEIDQNPEPVQASAQKSSGLGDSLSHVPFGLKQSPERRAPYTGGFIIGCKTGITQAAGPCFAGFYENEELGIRLAVIVLHSQTSDLRWHEIRQMLRWAHQCDRGQIRRKKHRRKINVQSHEVQREKDVRNARYFKQCKDIQKNILGL